MAKIMWTEDPSSVFKDRWRGDVGSLRVATVFRNRHRPDEWSVCVHLQPLPESLEEWLLKDRASEKLAKATAQRVVNAFTKILNGEATK